MAAFSQIGWNPLSGLIDWLSDAFQNTIVIPIMNFFSYLIGCIFYGLQMGLFYIMDAIQLVFRRVAGLDVYYDNGVAVEGDMVIKFFQDSTVQAVFFSILIAAIILLFITTFIAVLKTEFDEKDNAKGPVFKSALKAIAYFAIVPIVCFLGVMVSNIVLRMLDGATSRDAQSFSTQLFTAAAWDANRARNDMDFAKEVYLNCKWIPGMSSLTTGNTSEVIIEEQQNGTNQAYNNESVSNIVLADGDVTLTAYDQEAIADLIDQAFRGAYSPTTGTATIHGNKGWNYEQTFSVFSITSYDLVFYFYDPISYNYLIGYVGGFAICMLMLNLLIGVIQRIFELCVLFVLSPAAVALMPLDGGGRYNAWRGMFVKRVFSAYGPILGMNLVFMVLTLMQNVTIFPDGGINGLYNAIVQLIFIFTGLVSIRSLVDLVTELVGQGDALKQGEATGKQVKDFGAKAVGAAANIYMAPARAMNRVRRNRAARRDAAENLEYDDEGNVIGAGNTGTGTRGLNAMSRRQSARGALASAANRITRGRYGANSDANREAIALREENRTRRENAAEYLRAGGKVYGKDGEDMNLELKEGWKNSSVKEAVSNAWAATGLDKKVEEGAKKFGGGVPFVDGITGYYKGKAGAKAEKEAVEAFENQEKAREAYYRKHPEKRPPDPAGTGGAGSASGGSPTGGDATDYDLTQGTGENTGGTIADNERIFNQNYGGGTTNVNVANTPEVRIKQDKGEENAPIKTTLDTQEKPVEVKEKYTVDNLDEYARKEFERKGGNMTVDEFVAQRRENGTPDKLTLNADTIKAEELQREREENGWMNDVAQNADKINITANSTETEASDGKFQSASGDRLKIDDQGIRAAIDSLKTAISTTSVNIQNKLENIQKNTGNTANMINQQGSKLDNISKQVKEVTDKKEKSSGKSNAGSGRK